LDSCQLAIRGLFVLLLAEVPTEDRPDDPYGAACHQAPLAPLVRQAG
jgi:hypothetical protein